MIEDDVFCDGIKMHGKPSRILESLNGMIACAKRSGRDFVNTIKASLDAPDATIECYSEELRPCSEETSRTETVCMDKSLIPKFCPILDMVFIEVGEEQIWIDKGYNVTEKSMVLGS